MSHRLADALIDACKVAIDARRAELGPEPEPESYLDRLTFTTIASGAVIQYSYSMEQVASYEAQV